MSYANGGSLSDLIAARQGGATKSETLLNKDDLIAQRKLSKRFGKQTSSFENSPIHYFRSEELLLLFKDIVEGLVFLHEKDILHLDLKPANVLLDWKDGHKGIPTAMLSDFGSSFYQSSTKFENRTGETGTLEYTSPEALKKDQKGIFNSARDFKSDIWSLGMVLHEMLFLDLPWFPYGNNFDNLTNQILSYPGCVLIFF